jgi:hypothetical protein
MLDRWSRLAPLTAIPFGVLVVTAILINSSTTPDPKASGASVIAYYQAHGSDSKTADFIFIFAFIFFLFFAGSLRAHLRRSQEALSALVLVAATLLVAGLGIFSGIDLSLSDQPSRLTPAAAQALNLLNNDMFFLIIAGGCVFGISAGLAILRGAALPKWLGWLAIVIGIVSATPAGFFAFLAAMIWSLIVGILLYVRGGPVTAAPAPSAPAATSV